MPIATPKPIHIIKEVKSAHNARCKDNRHKALLKSSLFTPPIVLSELQLWNEVCDVAESYFEDDLDDAQAEAVGRFRKALLDAPVQAPPTTKLEKPSGATKVEIDAEVIAILVARIEELERGYERLTKLDAKTDLTISEAVAHVTKLQPSEASSENDFEPVGISHKERRALSARLDGLASRFSGLASKQERLERIFEKLSDRMDGAKDRYALAQNKAGNHDKKLWEHACVISGIQDTLNELEARVDACTQGSQGVVEGRGDAERVDQEVAMVHKKVEGIKAELDSLSKRTESVVRQMHLREINRALIWTGESAHPLPPIHDTAPCVGPISNEICPSLQLLTPDPVSIDAKCESEVNQWLDFYAIGEKTFEFMRNLTLGTKRLILRHFIGAN